MASSAMARLTVDTGRLLDEGDDVYRLVLMAALDLIAEAKDEIAREAKKGS